MSAERFDELARALAAGTSRRAVLGAAAASLAGAALALLGPRDAGAAPPCKPAGRRCKNGGQCCSGVCSSASGTCCVQSGGTPTQDRSGAVDLSSCCSLAASCDFSSGTAICTCN